MTDTILGKTASGPIDARDIELWDIPRNVQDIIYSGDQLGALCPVTNQPDIYEFLIMYGGKKTFESKGLKHYLWQFRNQGMSAEDLASTIAHELTLRLGSDVRVNLVQSTRGGMRLDVTAEGIQ